MRLDRGEIDDRSAASAFAQKRHGQTGRLEYIAEISLDVDFTGLVRLFHERLHEHPADYVDDDVDMAECRLRDGIEST